MTCPACGALSGAQDVQCRACGTALTGPPHPSTAAPGSEEITVVLKSRGAGSAQPTAVHPTQAPAALPTPAALPAVRAPGAGLVVSFDDGPAAAPAMAPPRGEPVPIPAPPAPWTLAPEAPAPPPPPAPPLLPAGPGDSPGPSPWRRWPVAVAATALAALVLAAAFLLLRPGDGDAQLAGSVLQAGRTRVTSIAERSASATRLLSLRQIGRDAGVARGELSSQESTLGRIGDPELRQRAAAVLESQTQYLGAMAALETLDREAVAAPRVPKLSSIQAAAAAALRRAQAGQAALATADLPGETALDLPAIREAGQRLSATVLGAHEDLARFDQSMRSYRAAVRRGEARARVVQAYRASVSGILSGYAADRRAVETAVARIDDADLERSLTQFEGFQRNRSATIDALNTALPSAPATSQAQAAHRTLTRPVETSMEGLAAALEAISVAEFDEEPVTTQPQWEAFQASSEQASRSLALAEQAWLGVVASLERAARARGVPPRPKAPAV